MALRNVLILRKQRSGCLEGRTALLQSIGANASRAEPPVSSMALTASQRLSPVRGSVRGQP